MQGRALVRLTGVACLFWIAALPPLPGQIQPSPGELAMSQAASKGAVMPAGQTSYELAFVADPSADGGDWLHVFRTEESTTLAIRNPSGTLINAETAAGMGFAWGEHTVTLSAEPDSSASEALGLNLDAIGTHTLLGFPAGQPAGTYMLIFNAGSTTEETLVLVEFLTKSPVAAGARTDATSYRTGDFVSAMAVVADDRAPVANATVTGRSMASRDVTDSVVVSGATLLDKSDLGNGLSHYRFRVQLQNNTASSTWRFAAKAETFAENARVVRAVLGFPPMAPGTSALSADSISVIAPTAPNFDASGLEWDVTAKSPPVALAFTDVSQVNDIPGDGVYGARFQPSETGNHVISLDINGTTAAGTPFYRNAATGFMVAAAQATVASITSEGVDANGNQKFEALRFIARIDVQEAGEYTLSFQIRDSAQRGHTFRRTTQLAAGAGSITQEVSARDLLENGIGNGPFSIVGVTLRRDVLGRDTIVDYHATMGVTPAYNLGDFERGSVYFTGQANEVALNLNGQAGRDRAAMTPVGVAAQESYPQTGGCSMDALSRGCFSGLAGRGAYAPRWVCPAWAGSSWLKGANRRR